MQDMKETQHAKEEEMCWAVSKEYEKLQ